MKIYHISKMGEFHVEHNEDASATVTLDDDKLLIAVMDGCSMGTESHFASTLIAKLLRKIGKEVSYKAFAERTRATVDNLLETVMEQLFLELKELKNRLLLETEEILSTLLLGICDTKQKRLSLMTVGDGLICCNGKYTEYEQDDKPDYLGYHLHKSFGEWYSSQTQRLHLSDVSDCSISTDGIFTFKKFDANEYPPVEDAEIIDYLLIENEDTENEKMLSKKLLHIEKKYGLKPSDDLTIIRLIL